MKVYIFHSSFLFFAFKHRFSQDGILWQLYDVFYHYFTLFPLINTRYHKPEGETTQWEDILAEKHIIPRRQVLFSMFYVMILSSRTLKRHLTKWWKITSSRKRLIPTRERTWMNSATSMYISLPPSRFVKLARIVGWRGQKVLWRIQACSPDI